MLDNIYGVLMHCLMECNPMNLVGDGGHHLWCADGISCNSCCCLMVVQKMCNPMHCLMAWWEGKMVRSKICRTNPWTGENRTSSSFLYIVEIEIENCQLGELPMKYLGAPMILDLL
jgi:hypothetical protein